MQNFWSAIPAMILMAILTVFLVALILQWLWNLTMPDVFGIKKITFWQSFRLFLIAAILFGGGSPLNFNKHTNASLNHEVRVIG